MNPEPAISIELPAALTVAAWAMTTILAGLAVLAGAVAWFLKREVKNNDEAHAELRGDVKKLLAGEVTWVDGIRADLRELRSRR